MRQCCTQPQTTRLNIRGDIYKSTGTIWLDDFAIYELGEGVYRDIEAIASGTVDGVEIRGGLPDANLELAATFRTAPTGCIRIDGTVRDTTGEDRAVGVRFSLPVDAEAWTWWTDAEERETIQPGGLYRHTYDCKAGVGLCSIYPWAAMTGAKSGLTMTLPLSQGPRCFVLQHDQRKPAMQATFYFGLCADAENNPSSAPFSLVLYTHDPQWGMRSAMQRYYELFPEAFRARTAPSKPPSPATPGSMRITGMWKSQFRSASPRRFQQHRRGRRGGCSLAASRRQNTRPPPGRREEHSTFPRASGW